MAFTSSLTPTPTAGKAVPYTWFTTLIANDNDLNDRGWSNYTPTWTNGTLGNGVLAGRYWQIGKLVIFRIDLIWGSTTSSSGSWAFSLPVTASNPSTRLFSVAVGEFIDTGTTAGDARGRINGTTTFLPFAGANQMGTTSPHTWANTDELHIIGVYEAA